MTTIRTAAPSGAVAPATWRICSHPRTQKNTTGVSVRNPSGHCRMCGRAADARWRASPEGRAVLARRDWTRRGIDPSFKYSDYLRMFVKQGRRCALCRKPPRRGKRLDTDHDHTDPTGRVRGLLHWRCNADVGQYEAGLLKNLKLTSKIREYLAAEGDARV